MMFDAAITYAERHTLHALVIARDGTKPMTRLGTGWDLDRPHPLFSGTKSFWGITAVAAAEDGLLDLDESVAATIDEWASDERKQGLNIRQLLTLTSGHGFGGLGNAVPSAAWAITIPLKHDPGTTFTYGGVPLQVFGEVLRRKVEPRFAGAHEYLQTRILDRIGMRIADWRRLRDGTQPLPTGAFVSAREWLRFGRLLLARGHGAIGSASFAQCITGTSQNPRYGLGFWLARSTVEPAAFYASGSGGQGLYVLPQHGIVAVHFGQSSSWDHAAFSARLTV